MRVNRLTILLVVFGVFLATHALMGLSIAPPYEPYDDLIRVAIIGDERGTLQPFSHYRSDKYFSPRLRVSARQGERYTIRVTNIANERVGLVVAVDGLNIISGERTSGSSNESMYVLDPGQIGSFSGWRSGMSHVQRFYFTSAGDSYAGRLGVSDQLGLIRVTAFRGRQVVYRPHEDVYLKSAAPERSMQESGPGTGYGENTWSPVSLTDFTPERYPSQTFEIKYEWSVPRYYKYDSSNEGQFAEPPPR